MLPYEMPRLESNRYVGTAEGKYYYLVTLKGVLGLILSFKSTFRRLFYYLDEALCFCYIILRGD